MTSRRTLLKTGLAVPALSVFNVKSALAGNTAATGMQKGGKIIDHIMWAAVDLDSASAEFERMSGVRPAFGGKHPGIGTHNALVSLANGSYMEVIALDPEQSGGHPVTEEIARLESPAILAFHVERRDLDGVAAVLGELNIKFSGPLDFSRERPDGLLLRWRLLFPESPTFRHALPIFIDWMDAPHPSTSAPQGCELRHFQVGHPDHVQLGAIYAQLGVSVPVVHASEAYAKAILDTPRGEVVLSGRL